MEDDAPIIYGLEFQARALTAQTAETDVVRFLVGTQSLKFDNQIHLLEYDDENNTVNKTIFLHSVGEIWHIDSSPKAPSLISTCYNQISPDGKYSKHGAIWKIPHDYRANNCCTDDSSSSLPSVELLMNLSVNDSDTDIKHVIWEPCAGNKIISVSDSSFSLWDLENSSILSLKASTSTNQKGRQKCISAKWNPHNNCNLLAVAIDSSVHSWDLRAMQPSWNIENAHGQLVRDLDFNPNKQYVLATCGDDCQIKFWDTRRCNSPLLILTDHSHWVWSVRYNNFHDQLVLSSSSDSRVILSRASSVSSEPFGHLVDDDEAVVSDETEFHTRKHVSDGVISLYEEHEDSVYAAEWSSADPWLFASLSYDGRLVINRVPRNEKYRILL